MSRSMARGLCGETKFGFLLDTFIVGIAVSPRPPATFRGCAGKRFLWFLLCGAVPPPLGRLGSLKWSIMAARDGGSGGGFLHRRVAEERGGFFMRKAGK